MTTEERDKLYLAPTYARFPVHIVRGEGRRLFDADGKEYLDKVDIQENPKDLALLLEALQPYRK